MILILVLALGPASPGQTPPFECFAVTDLVRVFEDGYECPVPQSRVDVFGVRNEYVSAQCVVKAGEDLAR